MVEVDWCKVADIIAFVGSLALFYPAMRIDKLKWFLRSRRNTLPNVSPLHTALVNANKEIQAVAEDKINGWQLLDSILLYLGLVSLITSFGIRLGC